MIKHGAEHQAAPANVFFLLFFSALAALAPPPIVQWLRPTERECSDSNLDRILVYEARI